jgi:hypothetical protein
MLRALTTMIMAAPLGHRIVVNVMLYDALLAAWKVVLEFESHSLRQRVLDVEHSLAKYRKSANIRRDRRVQADWRMLMSFSLPWCREFLSGCDSGGPLRQQPELGMRT